MSGRGDEQTTRAILRALEKGPLDVVDLLAALRTRLPDLLALREGAVHAVLHRAVRKGGVLAEGFSSRGLTLYRPLDTPAPPGNTELPPLGPVASPSLAKAALRAASSVRDPASRGRVQADVLAHLESLGKETAQFGSVRGVRQLLYRVDRGKPAVCLTAGAGDTARRLLLHEGPWLAGAVLVWFLLKIFVVQTYVIPSESMVPTLLRQDRVVVFLFSKGEVPARWTVATFEGEDKTLVKRLVGLPGERIAILHGDVYIETEPEQFELLVKPDDVRAALRARIGDWDLRAVQAGSGWTPSTSDDGATRIWRSRHFEARRRRIAMEQGAEPAMRDGYVRLDVGAPDQGPVRLIVTRGPGERGGPGADNGTIEWTLRAGPQGIQLDEQRVGADPAAATHRLARAASTGGSPVSLEISYVDGVLRASAGGLAFEAPRAAPDGPLILRIEVPAASTSPLHLTLDRDIHYARLGTHGLPHGSVPHRPLSHEIPAGHLYFLGDNTTGSHDSRFSDLGDISVGKVIGPVSFRIWPPSRWGHVR